MSTDAREKAVERLAVLFTERFRRTHIGTIDLMIRNRLHANTPEGGDTEGQAAREWAERTHELRWLLNQLGLVAIDPALVDAVRAGKDAERARAAKEGYAPKLETLTTGPYYEAEPSEYAEACAALAEAVLAQLTVKT